MQKTNRNYFYTIVLSGLIILCMGYLYSIYCSKATTAQDLATLSSGTLGDLLGRLEERETPQLYGKQIKGFLSWEKDRPFLELCGQQGAILRMAAYQITFPDSSPGEKSNVVLAADLLAGKVVQPGEIFSLNKAIGPYTRERGFCKGPAYSGSNVVEIVGGGVCKIATTLYNAAILSNLEILERHPHNMLVTYVSPGRDAAIVYGVQNFSFKNNTAHPLVIWAGTREDTLTIAIYGSEHPPLVTWNHELLCWQKRHTLYRHNPNLLPGEEKVVVSGSDSVTVKSWLEIEEHDGTKTVKKMGVDYYRPMPRVVEKIFLK